MSSEWVKVGVVGRAHSLRGAFFVSYRDDAIPKAYGSVRIGESPTQSEPFEIRSSKMMSGRPLLHCGGFSRREHAEAFVGKPIWVHRSQISVDESKQYLWSDLIGKTVADNTGAEFGTIVEVRNYGASDVAVIKSAGKGTVEVAIVGDYFDLKFSRTSASLQLVVPGSTFAELWSTKGDS